MSVIGGRCDANVFRLGPQRTTINLGHFAPLDSGFPKRSGKFSKASDVRRACLNTLSIAVEVVGQFLSALCSGHVALSALTLLCLAVGASTVGDFVSHHPAEAAMLRQSSIVVAAQNFLRYAYRNDVEVLLIHRCSDS